jgi:hypothetical protein
VQALVPVVAAVFRPKQIIVKSESVFAALQQEYMQQLQQLLGASQNDDDDDQSRRGGDDAGLNAALLAGHGVERVVDNINTNVRTEDQLLGAAKTAAGGASNATDAQDDGASPALRLDEVKKNADIESKQAESHNKTSESKRKKPKKSSSDSILTAKIKIPDGVFAKGRAQATFQSSFFVTDLSTKAGP